MQKCTTLYPQNIWIQMFSCYLKCFLPDSQWNSKNLAKTIHDETISTLKNWANKYNIAICGSFIAKDNENYYNRGFFISSDKEYYYDKHHLFRIGKKVSFSHGGISDLYLIIMDLIFAYSFVMIFASRFGLEMSIMNMIY